MTITIPSISTHVLVGAALFNAGLGLRLWSIWHLLKAKHNKLSIAAIIKPPGGWITSGPYRYLRHPMYLGTLMMLAGIGCVALSYPGLVLFTPAVPHLAARVVAENALIARES